MNAIYICANCRRQLFRKPAIAGASQCLSKAGFISFSGQRPVEVSQDNGTGKPPAGVVRRTGGKRVGTRDPLEALFVVRDGVKKPQQAQRQAVRSSAGITTYQSCLKELEQSLADQQKAVSDSWELFQRYYGTRESVGFRSLSTQDRVLLSRGTAFRQLLEAIVAAWAEREQFPQLATPAEAVRLFAHLGIMREDYWSNTLWAMLRRILEKCGDSDTAREPAEVTDRYQGDTPFLEDTLDVWRAFFKENGTERKPIGASDWPGLPGVGELGEAGVHSSKCYTKRFLHFFPNLSPTGSGRNVSFAAALTFAILHSRRRGPFESVGASQVIPFSRFVAHLLPYSEPVDRISGRYLKSLNFPTEAYHGMLAGWEDLVNTALVILASDGAGKSSQVSSPKRRVGSKKGLEAAFLKRLNSSLEEKNLKRAEDVWHNARVWYSGRGDSSETKELLGDTRGSEYLGKSELSVEGAQNKANLKMPVNLYNRFILVFMALGQHGRAVDVWNDMILAGQEPTVASWHAFIDGCRKARDAKGIEAVWRRMLASGVRPDAWCWTTRIHGLIDCGKWELGIEVLQQMGIIWLEAAKSQKGAKAKGGRNIDKTRISAMGDIGDCIKPNTATINATIAALLRQRRVDAAERVLRWASSLGIPSDVITFNTLLRPMIKTGNISEALALVKEMEPLGVKPDVATFTIVIDGLFLDLTSPTSEAEQNTQITTITSLLAEMEAVGIPANVRSYGTLIDGLLSTHKNLPATRAVLAHMVSRGIKPSTHIYTILLMHHFSQTPPDLSAIEALWHRIQLDNTCTPDLIFYERMIEGYAQIGNTSKMLYFLNRLPREGKAPSWYLLGKVVGALVEKEDWEGVERVVEDVMYEKGIAEGGVKGWGGKEEFWELVKAVEGRWRGPI
ncbi:hypothetical protein FGG08_003606 [Glutinoglossum americanum]|uniref:Pentatricopeptide repeat-containing protein n=1 Tax=Glutinoglossum americanum TaxID=1670608 RepID=A0A9P8KXY5_9PEZI|nr:hypothetical protein FGG08_003606 [Glutinoglossum americanum]